MTNDQKINIILESIKKLGTIPLYDWIARELNEHDRQSENNHRIIINKMVDNGLIKRARDGSERYEVTTKGIDITEKGGWLKHLIDQMTEEQKVHRLLEFMAKTGEYHWSPETLMPAFDNLLNESEIEYLCLILIDNGDVNDNRTKDGFAIGFSERSKSVFHGKKYLKARPTHEIKIDVGQI